ncbi:CD81 antigen isoform X1 [Serinus canaria]|uniref:CD81 antigen isoform X1 n=1 Tax=Serinus canaria TaxID=9135 RepID=UPI0021CC5F82|nr:CD81 antigen isoform X1 [Serinus canaria]
MGVEGCTKCIKYLLFVFNFIFWLAGGIILGVALWLRHDSQTTNILYLQLGDKQAPNTFYVGIYILIAVGAVMMFVGFLGCYGAIQESQCLLGTFFTCLVILFACEVAAGIWGFVNKDQIAKDVKQFYDQALQQALMGESDANNAKAVVKTFHETLDCCGSDIITSTFTPVWRDDLCRKDSLKSFFENTNRLCGLSPPPTAQSRAPKSQALPTLLKPLHHCLYPQICLNKSYCRPEYSNKK